MRKVYYMTPVVTDNIRIHQFSIFCKWRVKHCSTVFPMSPSFLYSLRYRNCSHPKYMWIVCLRTLSSQWSPIDYITLLKRTTAKKKGALQNILHVDVVQVNMDIFFHDECYHFKQSRTMISIQHISHMIDLQVDIY